LYRAGDNAASWQSLAQSLPQILSYGLQGIPMGGADTGFSGDISEELCARWVSLSAIAYPFARSHSDLHSRHQEPYLWPSVLKAAKKSLEMRYKLLSYFYTLHRIASENGMPVMRPLWVNYPRDGSTHEIDRQVMLGEAFLVTPVLEEGVEKVKGYFPSGTVWYDMFEESESIDAR
jgi:alpha-glucosidase